MTHTQTVLRIAAQKKTDWKPEDRDRTINGFLNEIGRVVSEEVIEKLATDYPDKLESMFIDWVQFAKRRTPDQRVALMVSSVAKSALPIPFAIASVTEDPDLQAPEPSASNVVSFVSVR